MKCHLRFNLLPSIIGMGYMKTCSEIAIFKVPRENRDRVIALSHAVVEEINTPIPIILSHDILLKTDDKETLCWHLTWVNQDAVARTAKKWPNFSSTHELESLVEGKVYYGHFISLF